MNWLLLRGLSREQRHFGRFVEVFEEMVPGSRAHCLDLPGMGTECGRRSPATAEAIAEDVRARWCALRDATSNGDTWGLFGLSLGGMVALAWCSAHPEDFAALVVAASSAGDLSPTWRRLNPKAWGVLARALREKDPVRCEALMLSVMSRLCTNVDAVAADWARYRQERPATRANVLRQLKAAMAFRLPATLSTPALCAVGEGDGMVHPSCSRLLASAIGAKLVVHPGAGHELTLDAPQWMAQSIGDFAAGLPSTGGARVLRRPMNLAGYPPLVVTPASAQNRSLEVLLEWISAREGEINKDLTTHGAVLFRGFDVDSPAAFERVARNLVPDPEIAREDGTRVLQTGITDHAFWLGERSSWDPVPPHCAGSFVLLPPRRVLFYGVETRRGVGGDVALVDFRRVAREIDPATRSRFVEKGVKNIRNMEGPEGGPLVDPPGRRRWHEVFGSRARAAVEASCRQHGFDFTWKPRGGLRLMNVQPALRMHPATGDPVWFNHAHVFHLWTAADEYPRIAERLGRVRYRALASAATAAAQVRALTAIDEDQELDCTFGDGCRIDRKDMAAVRDAIWKSTVFFRLQRGDVLLIDNESTGHGRLPYGGSLRVIAASAKATRPTQAPSLGRVSN